MTILPPGAPKHPLRLPVAYNLHPSPYVGNFPLHTRNGTRVRWDAAERALLVRQSQIVLAAKPGESLKDVIAEAMLSLPSERRRKVDVKTVAWIREAVRALPPLATKAAPVSDSKVEPAPEALSTQNSPAQDTQTAPSAAPSLSPLAAAVVDSAVGVLVGILTDPRLRLAVRGLLAPSSAASVDNTNKGTVVVVGLQPGDAKTVERTYQGMLPLRTWTVEQTREQLEECVDNARLVIGMQDQLSQAIDSSLRRLGARYVSNHGGMQGLHKRLAEEAMR